MTDSTVPIGEVTGYDSQGYELKPNEVFQIYAYGINLNIVTVAPTAEGPTGNKIMITQPKGFPAEMLALGSSNSDVRIPVIGQQVYQAIFASQNGDNYNIDQPESTDLDTITIEIPQGLELPIRINAVNSKLSLADFNDRAQLSLSNSTAELTKLGQDTKIDISLEENSRISVSNSTIDSLRINGRSGAGITEIKGTEINSTNIITDGLVKIGGKSRLNKVYLRSSNISDTETTLDHPELASIYISETALNPDNDVRILLGNQTTVFFDTRFGDSRHYLVAMDLVQHGRLLRAQAKGLWSIITENDVKESLINCFYSFFMNYAFGRKPQRIEISPISKGDLGTVLLR